MEEICVELQKITAISGGQSSKAPALSILANESKLYDQIQLGLIFNSIIDRIVRMFTFLRNSL